MNLIEQLGGYNSAILRQHVNYLNDAIDSDLDKALLQYRREHGIYEKGDPCKISTKHDYGLYKFLRMRDDRIYLEDRLGFSEFGIAASAVSHATDAEIQCGHRLPFVESIHDKDIPPNTIVLER